MLEKKSGFSNYLYMLLAYFFAAGAFHGSMRSSIFIVTMDLLVLEGGFIKNRTVCALRSTS